MELKPRLATKLEIEQEQKRCFSPQCKANAWLIDYGGGRWCFKHWFRSWRWGQDFSWYYLKTTKIWNTRKGVENGLD